MATREVLILALTRMRSGICTAGMIAEPHPTSHLQWVRPVKDYGTLLLGDMTDANNRVVQIGDVVELTLLQARLTPPHNEDWITDFVKRRPQVVRQLSEQKRADFLASHSDLSPCQVLNDQSRSLCLVHPQEVWASFTLDPYSGEYKAKLGFRLSGTEAAFTTPTQGLPVTDLKWRALGRQWLAQDGHERLQLDHATLLKRLHADDLHLAIGLGRSYQDAHWTLVVGVHPVPDYTAVIDYNNL